LLQVHLAIPTFFTQGFTSTGSSHSCQQKRYYEFTLSCCIPSYEKLTSPRYLSGEVALPLEAWVFPSTRFRCPSKALARVRPCSSRTSSVTRLVPRSAALLSGAIANGLPYY